MPTGSGKSLCYQLPALLRDDLTVVVSPLVALMQDQVEALAARGLGERVALVNAQQDPAANADTLRRAAGGELKLLYVAPERFSSLGFLEQMSESRVGLFVVDEAHCVSQWGHDFRPDYFRLAEAARKLGAGAIVASTATATPRVALDVARRLGLRDPLKVSTGFDRPNLVFAVARPAPYEKRPLVAQVLREPDALPAIVYAGTRAGSEELAAELEAALSEPASLEAYYQEAGRAGRDGAGARALLLAENRDKALHVHFIRRDEVEHGLPGWLADRLAANADGDGRYSLDGAALARGLGGDGDKLRSLVGHLTRAGVVRPSPSAPDRVAGAVTAPYDRRADALCRASIEEAARARWRQYREIWAYVESGGCRRQAILDHFGDSSDRKSTRL